MHKVYSDRDNRYSTNWAKKTLIVSILFALVISLIPTEVVDAAVKGKSKVKQNKAKYGVTITNADSNTVIEKGKKFRIHYTAKKTVGSKSSKAKVRFKSSNKKIATVTSKGVIKAKKKGTTKITIYCKGKPKVKKTIKVRVGTQVHTIALKGYQHLRVGGSSNINATVNNNATNKTVKWSSSNSSVIKVDNKGKIKAQKEGKATIYASAIDGSGTTESIDVYVHNDRKDDANWIAHRGLHIQAIENTADAFTAAGKAGFWGCECDIWETKHEYKEIVTEPAADESQEDAVIEENEDVVDAPLTEALDVDEDPDQVMSDSSQDPIEDMSEDTQADSISDNTLPVVTTTQSAATTTEESFDIVINHDRSFKRTMSVDLQVRDMTATEIKKSVPKACFFGDYLDICKRYGMVPIVEFKDPQMSDAAIQMAVDMMAERDMLQNAYFISSYSDILSRARTCAAQKHDGAPPYTAFLIGNKASDKHIQIAKDNDFGCISITYAMLTDAFYHDCVNNGLKVGTWTYQDNAYNNERMYQHVLSGKYDLEFATVDYKPF